MGRYNSQYCSNECRAAYLRGYRAGYRPPTPTKESIYDKYKKSVTKNRKVFTLTIDDYFELISRPCVYCGTTEKPRGINRIIKSKGYTLDNVEPCCSFCSGMKWTLSTDQLLRHCEKIMIHQRIIQSKH
jgi:hypothetical protein